jgi:plasmid replication initiation protein
VSLYMVVEHFRNGDAAPVYRRFRERGRMAPGGLKYVSSWVDESLAICYQLMETDDRSLLENWMQHWADLVEFEVHRVVTSQEAAERIAPRLEG